MTAGAPYTIVSAKDAKARFGELLGAALTGTAPRAALVQRKQLAGAVNGEWGAF